MAMLVISRLGSPQNGYIQVRKSSHGAISMGFFWVKEPRVAEVQKTREAFRSPWLLFVFSGHVILLQRTAWVWVKIIKKITTPKLHAL